MTVVVVVAVALVAALAGCTSAGSRPPVASSQLASTPPSAGMTQCTGREGEAVLRAFFDDLSHGGSNLLTAYFAPAQDFVRWWDPTRGSGEVVPYTGLQEHLGKLQQDGADAAVIGFIDGGFEGRGTSEAGGWFQFDLRGRLSKDAEVRVGSGKGAIDCRTGKLMVVVFGWR